MVKIYIELQARKGLTQIGFFKNEPGFIPNSKVLQIPFSLVEDFMADTFNSEPEAVVFANKALQSLNFGFYKSISVDFMEVQNEK